MPSNEFTCRVKQARNTLIQLSIFFIVSLAPSCSVLGPERPPLRNVETIAGQNKEFGEPFGIAFADSVTYVSDGERGTVSMISAKGISVESGFDTPSGICIGSDGKALVADSGRNAIYRLDPIPNLVAGGSRGNEDGDAASAGFNSPIGVACSGDRIYVTDTYNDRIRVIENGQVRTLAGTDRGYMDGIEAKFDTPTGIAVWMDKLLVADTGNHRIRVVEPDGRVWTLAGNGDEELRNGSLSSASFVQPTGIVIDTSGTIFVADGNSIRTIGGPLPVVRTFAGGNRGIWDGSRHESRFNRISGLAFDGNGDLVVTDSENRLIRRVTSNANAKKLSPEALASIGTTPAEFRNAAPGRWPYDPPNAKRDVAGTLGEIRGEITENSDPVWFHNGLDIAGGFGETARFIRDEKVLRPVASEHFDTLRELIRMPTLGYIHIRLGRDSTGKPFEDPRFQFQRDASGKLSGVRVPRGSKFAAGEPIGTLNPMNHVHLIAGRSGSEMNALDALDLPGFTDSRSPVIEKVSVFDQKWVPVETVSNILRINDKIRVVVRAYDQVDGNAERRRLGVYKLGYQVLRRDGSSMFEPRWNINFDKMPSNDAVGFAYSLGSHSGATGETIFNYIVTNYVNGDEYRDGFLDTREIGSGRFTLRVFAADHSGNISSKDAEIEVNQ